MLGDFRKEPGSRRVQDYYYFFYSLTLCEVGHKTRDKTRCFCSGSLPSLPCVTSFHGLNFLGIPKDMARARPLWRRPDVPQGSTEGRQLSVLGGRVGGSFPWATDALFTS